MHLPKTFQPPHTVEQIRPQDDVDALEPVSDTEGCLRQLHLKHHDDVVQKIDREVCTHVVG